MCVCECACVPQRHFLSIEASTKRTRLNISTVRCKCVTKGELLLCKEMETIWWSAKMMHRIENVQVFFKLLIISFRDNRWAFGPLLRHYAQFGIPYTNHFTSFVPALFIHLVLSFCWCDGTERFVTKHEHMIQKKQTISTQQKCFSLASKQEWKFQTLANKKFVSQHRIAPNRIK